MSMEDQTNALHDWSLMATQMILELQESQNRLDVAMIRSQEAVQRLNVAVEQSREAVQRLDAAVEQLKESSERRAQTMQALLQYMPVLQAEIVRLDNRIDEAQ